MFRASKATRQNPRHLAWFTIAAVTGFWIGHSILEGLFSFAARFASDGLLIMTVIFGFVAFCIGNIGYDRNAFRVRRHSDIWIRIAGGFALGLGIHLIHIFIHHWPSDALQVFIKRRGQLFEFSCLFMTGMVLSLSTEFSARAFRAWLKHKSTNDEHI